MLEPSPPIINWHQGVSKKMAAHKICGGMHQNTTENSLGNVQIRKRRSLGYVTEKDMLVCRTSASLSYKSGIILIKAS